MTKWGTFGDTRPRAAERLVVFTGMNGCSAQKNDSKPSSSAFLAMAPGSTQYAGSGTETPTFMSFPLHVASEVDDAPELAPPAVRGQGMCASSRSCGRTRCPSAAPEPLASEVERTTHAAVPIGFRSAEGLRGGIALGG